MNAGSSKASSVGLRIPKHNSPRATPAGGCRRRRAGPAPLSSTRVRTAWPEKTGEMGTLIAPSRSTARCQARASADWPSVIATRSPRPTPDVGKLPGDPHRAAAQIGECDLHRRPAGPGVRSRPPHLAAPAPGGRRPPRQCSPRCQIPPARRSPPGPPPPTTRARVRTFRGASPGLPAPSARADRRTGRAPGLQPHRHRRI